MTFYFDFFPLTLINLYREIDGNRIWALIPFWLRIKIRAKIFELNELKVVESLNNRIYFGEIDQNNGSLSVFPVQNEWRKDQNHKWYLSNGNRDLVVNSAMDLNQEQKSQQNPAIYTSCYEYIELNRTTKRFNELKTHRKV